MSTIKDMSQLGELFAAHPDGLDGDRHAWIVIGGFVAVIFNFRIAYSAISPARLAKHINLHFDPDKAL